MNNSLSIDTSYKRKLELQKKSEESFVVNFDGWFYNWAETKSPYTNHDMSYYLKTFSPK